MEVKGSVGIYAGMEGSYGEHKECLTKDDMPDFIAIGFFATFDKNTDDEHRKFIGSVITNRSDKNMTESLSYPVNGMTNFVLVFAGEAINDSGVDLFNELSEKFTEELKQIDLLRSKYLVSDEDEEFYCLKVNVDNSDRLSILYPGDDLDLEDAPKSNGVNFLGQMIKL